MYTIKQGHIISERKKKHVLPHTGNPANNIGIYVNKCTSGYRITCRKKKQERLNSMGCSKTEYRKWTWVMTECIKSTVFLPLILSGILCFWWLISIGKLHLWWKCEIQGKHQSLRTTLLTTKKFIKMYRLRTLFMLMCEVLLSYNKVYKILND